MRRRKRAMACRMPVLGQRDMAETFGEAINDRHHCVAIAHRKRPARTEIILHVDYQQQVTVSELGIDHFGTALSNRRVQATSARIDISSVGRASCVASANDQMPTLESKRAGVSRPVQPKKLG